MKTISQSKPMMRISLTKKQAGFVFSGADFPVFIGGIGSGKTYGGAFKAIMKALKNPNCDGLITANTYKQLQKATLATFFDVLDMMKIRYKHLKYEKVITVYAGDKEVKIHTQSMESYDDMRGLEVGWIWMDEARDYVHDAFKVAIGRLRAPGVDQHQCWITTTPRGFNWIWEEFINKKRASCEVFLSKSSENRFLPDTYIDMQLEYLDERMAKQELDAEFLNILQDRVYHAFSRDLHVKKKLMYDPTMPLIITLDFNVDPMTASIIQQHGQETWQIDEIYLRNSNVMETIKVFSRIYHDHLGPIKVYGDAAGRARSVTSDHTSWQIVEMELKKTFGNIEFVVKSANPSVMDRINAVNARLKNAKGKTHFYIAECCPETIRDFEQLSKKEGTQEPDKTKNKMLSHSTDNVGYYLAHEFPILGNRRWGSQRR